MANFYHLKMKNKYCTRFLYYSFYLILTPFVSSAQTFDEIKKLYSQEQAVFLNKTLHYNISIKEGKPYVESNEQQQIEYLTSDAPAYMRSYGFFQSDFQEVVAYEAFTLTPGDKKLKVKDFKTSASNEDFVFYDDSKETTFDFPSVEQGSIGNLHVSWINKNPYLLSPYYFSSYIPVMNSEIKITFPKDMSIKFLLKGLDTMNITLQIEKTHKEYTYIYSYKNCPSLKRYTDAPSSPWYATHLIFYIENYKDDNGNKVQYLSDLNDLYQLNYGYTKTINLTISEDLKHIVDSLTSHAHNTEEKARNIYSWVQQNIKYVAFEQGMEGFVPREAGLVCSRRFGDCKDMSSILTIMMKAADIPAYYTWIGTRNMPYQFSELPLPIVSNHMICTILLNGKYIFLDGTDPTCLFGFPSSAIQDKEAMIAIGEKDFKILKVPIVEKKFNRVVDSTWLELNPEGIKGTIKRCLTGYFSMNLHGKLMYTSKSDLKQEMKAEFSRGSNKFQLDSFSITPLHNPDTILTAATFKLPDYAKKLGKDWYINLNLFKFYEHEEIDYPKRKMPIEYNFKSEQKYVTLLKIPDGYKLESLPESKSFHNDVWGFELRYEQKGNLLILTQEFDNDHIQITNDQFERWNKVLEHLFPMYKETLSLTKVP